MVWFLKNHTYSIGVDIADDGLNIAQLANNGNGAISLVDGGSRTLPEDIKPGSSDCQKWAIEVIRKLLATGKFRGKDVIAAIPANEVFIDHIRLPKIDADKIIDVIFSKIKQKLPFEPIKENTMIKYIPAEDDNVLVMAAERKIIDRHLAIYEETGLKIKSIGVWPIAMANSYAKFFGRRKTDIEVVVMLVCIEQNYTNVVICRHKNLLFARSIPIGTQQISTLDCRQTSVVRQVDSESPPNCNEGPVEAEKLITRLVLELTSCKRQFSSIYHRNQIERVVFFSNPAVDKNIYATIAKQLEMPAQLGDCLAAVEITEPWRLDIERRSSFSNNTALQNKQHVNWAIAFGLSLSE